MRITAAALVCALTACSNDPAPPAVQGPNVLFVMIDTLRRDHLHLYGYERETSPAIDRLGREGWVFDSHISHASHTVPATISMMVSRYPVEHGIVHRYYRQFVEEPPYFPEDLVFLSEAFKEHGYATAGYVANPHLGERNGFRQGFDRFVFEPMEGGEVMTAAAEKWIRKTAGRQRPFFLYLHYMDVHSPYRAKPHYAERYAPPEGELLDIEFGLVEGVAPEDLAATVAMYDACINHVDDQIERLVETLESAGIRDETVIVVTSDHGEEFLEHGGLGHGTTVYGELVRIPLVVSYRPQLAPGKRVEHLTRHIDVAPTLLDLAGLPVSPAFNGASLHTPARDAFAEDGPWRSIHAEGKSLILNKETGRSTLFHADDVLDQEPIEDAEAHARLLSRLEQYLDLEEAGGTHTGPRTRAPAWNEHELELLKSLGYAE